MTASPGTRDAGLLRAVGPLGLAAAIANVTIGGGIFRLPSVVAESLGPAAPVAYVVCASVMAMIAMSIAEAGSRVSATGGPYAYVETAFGPFAGYMVGVMTWMIGVTAVAAVANVFIDSLGAIAPAFASPGGRAAGLVLVFGLFAVVNVIGVEHGSRLNTLTIVLKLVPLVLLVALGIGAVQPANLAVTDTPTVSTITRTSIVLLFAFTGVESAMVPGGEVRDPSRTVPRAILIGMSGVTILYLVVQLVAQGVLGGALAASKTPLADAAGVAMGPWGRQLLLVGVVVSTFGYLSGMSLASPRSLYAFGRDGYLPRAVAAVHPRFRTPWVAVIVQLTLVCALAISSSFGALAVISNVAALLVYFGCAAGAWQLRRLGIQEPGTTPFRMPAGAVVPWVACAAILGLLTSITAAEWLVLAEVAGVATVVFLVARRRKGQTRGA
ncbi:MAG: APC family permease [Gemmatimonadetes bacterium]|nr:APC family permease [Gemmatimonadota bacterium]